MRHHLRIAIISGAILVSFILHSYSVHAFFIPGSIQIFGAAVSNLFAYLIILVMAFFGSIFVSMKNPLKRFGLRLKKNVRTYAWILFTLVLISISLVTFSEYRRLQDLNVPETTSFGFESNAFEGAQMINSSLNISFYGGDSEPFYVFTIYELEKVGLEGLIDIYDNIERSDNLCIDFSVYLNISRSKGGPFLDMLKDEVKRDPTTEIRLSANYSLKANLSSTSYEKLMEKGEYIFINAHSNLCSSEPSHLFFLDSLSRYYAYGAEVNLDDYSFEDIENRKIISSISPEDFSEIFRFELSEYIEYRTLLDNPKKLSERLDHFKDDKILFLCSGGGTARTYAVLLTMLGFDVKSSGVLSTMNDELLDQEGLSKRNIENAIMINTVENIPNRNQNIFYIYHGLGAIHSECIEYLETKTGGHFSEVPAYDHMLSDSYDKDYESVSRSEIMRSSVICRDRLDCLLTQYWLYQNEIPKHVIYYAGEGCGKKV